MFLDIFNSEYYPKLGKRAETMKSIIKLLGEKKDALIVETGTIRQEDNWEWDGQSTIVWDAYVQHNGGRVFSVDFDPLAVSFAKTKLSKQSSVICSDSLAYLKDFPEKEKIDLLYLDAMDAHLPEAGMHHMFELTQVWSSLKKGCIIAVDDVLSPTQGKHAVIAYFLALLGYEPKVWGYQMGWVK